MASKDLDYLYHHIFLPSHLPYFDDSENGSGDRALVNRLIQLAQQYRDLHYSQHYAQWTALCRAIRTFALLHRNNNSLDKDALQKSLRELRDGGIIILHIAMQNSGIIIRKNAKEYIIETFEASPPASEVLAAQTALQWDSPSRAVAVPCALFEGTTFQESLTEFLEKASIEPVKQFSAVALKAGSCPFESRDKPAPAIVGQLLMAILEANGYKHTPMITRKRVHDEVCFGDGAEKPWRRSATWLVVRVGIQRSLCFLLGGSLGTLHYKLFLCFVFASVSRSLGAEQSSPSDRLAFARTRFARRVAKLQRRKESTTADMAHAIASLFAKHEKDFTDVLRLINDRIGREWSLIRI